MRIALLILIGIHGIIHLFGFLKAFELAKFDAISQPISRAIGLVWLLVFLLFTVTFFLFLFHANYWWLCGFLAVISSQALILCYWSDAKYGTVANLIILGAVIIAYSNFNFKKKIAAERELMFEKAAPGGENVITKATLSNLPIPVQNWLMNVGIIDKRPISNVRLIQELQLKLKPEQEDWNKGTAEQYFTVNPPAFNWDITTRMNSVLGVVGRDKFENGTGEMNIKLLSLVSVADAKNGTKVDQATLQRYLAEIVWFPSAALSPYIKWEKLGKYSAKATMEYKGAKGSGEFHFDEDGNFKKFVAMRYQDSNAAEPTEWTVIATQIEERNGIKIPVECEASWKLASGEWTWLRLKVEDIQYNVKQMPVANDVVSKKGKIEATVADSTLR